MLFFDDLLEEFCNSEVFVVFATAGRYRGLSNIYIQHNLFRERILGLDIEHQNANIILFKSPRDVMQVSTLSKQLGLRSELFDWYRDAILVPHGH